MVVEGADVAHKGRGVDDRSCSFSQGVVPIGVGNFFFFKSTPLIYQVVVTVVAHLENKDFGKQGLAPLINNFQSCQTCGPIEGY